MNLENLAKPGGFGSCLRRATRFAAPRAGPGFALRCPMLTPPCARVSSCGAADPFENAGDDDEQSADIHIRVQQRNGRKCITTVQGIDAALDLKKVLKVIKKVPRAAHSRESARGRARWRTRVRCGSDDGACDAYPLPGRGRARRSTAATATSSMTRPWDRCARRCRSRARPTGPLPTSSPDHLLTLRAPSAPRRARSPRAGASVPGRPTRQHRQVPHREPARPQGEDQDAWLLTPTLIAPGRARRPARASPARGSQPLSLPSSTPTLTGSSPTAAIRRAHTVSSSEQAARARWLAGRVGAAAAAA